MPDDPLLAVLKRPFAEQVAFFRRKLAELVPTARWDDILREAHDNAFMVAGAAKADLLADLAAAVARALTEGRGLDEFRKDFRAIVERNGWHGWTGEGTNAGEAWRTRVIYRTNATTSYAAGRYAQLVEGQFDLWVYRHGGSREPRPQHLAWDGLTLPSTHDFWRKHAPPNGWGCSCYIVGARSKTGAKRVGGDPDKQLPDDWNAIDPRTGAPVGIDRGWDYAPGASAASNVAALAEKIRHWEYAIAKAFMDEVPPSLRDALARAYRGLPSVADDARRYAERVLAQPAGAVEIEPARTLGLLRTYDVEEVARLKGDDVTGFDFSIDRSVIGHILRKHGNEATEAPRGQRAVTAADYRQLPIILNAPDDIEDAGVSDVGRPLLLYTKRIDGEMFMAAFEVRGGRRTLALQSLRIRRSS